MEEVNNKQTLAETPTLPQQIPKIAAKPQNGSRKKDSRKFWDFVYEDGESTLRINGYIAEESWFSDDVTPALFRKELSDCKGDITVWINSPGGDVFAASQIYAMLKEHKGNVRVKVDGVAASAASVIAMAGSSVEMTPTACIMIHNPATFIFGEVGDLEQGIEMLSEVKEAIINAYEQKTKLPRDTISKMMDAETWMNANKAVELGFADKVLYSDTAEDDSSYLFNRGSCLAATVNAMRSKLKKKEEPAREPQVSATEVQGTDITVLEKRLSLIK